MNRSKFQRLSAVLSGLLLSGLCGTAVAQQSVQQTAPEQRQEIAFENQLDSAAVAQILTPTDALAGSFEQQKYLAVLPRPLNSSGHFDYAAGKGLEWAIEKPIASTVIISEQGISQQQGGKVVWQSDANSAETSTVANIMAAIFAGDLQTLSATFDISGQQSADNQYWQLQLTPQSDVLKNFFNRIDMSGQLNSTGQNLLRGLTLHEANGDRTEIRFSLTRLHDQ